MEWWQLFVKAPAGSGYTTPTAMKRVDEHLNMVGAAMKAPPPQGMPVQEADGTWEVQVYSEASLPLVKGLLKSHYGLEIVREVKHSS
jgi:hypothetical protein